MILSHRGDEAFVGAVAYILGLSEATETTVVPMESLRTAVTARCSLVSLGSKMSRCPTGLACPQEVEDYLYAMWVDSNYRLLRDPHIAAKMLDLGLSFGVSAANTLLLVAYNMIHPRKLKVSDRLEGSSLTEINTSKTPRALLCTLRGEAYKHVCTLFPKVSKSGWIERAMA